MTFTKNAEFNVLVIRCLLICLLFSTTPTLKAQLPPANDLKINATDLSAYIDNHDTTLVFSTVGAGTDNTGSETFYHNIWFTFTAPNNGFITAKLARYGVDYLNGGFLGIMNSNGDYLGSFDILNLAQGEISISGLTADSLYHISVGAKSSSPAAAGDFSLALKSSLNFDFQAGAVDLTNIIDSDSTLVFSNDFAFTDGPVSLNVYNDVWFKFTAPATGALTVDFGRETQSNYLSGGKLYLVDSADNWSNGLSLVNATEGTRSFSGLVPNADYYLSVGASSTNASAKGNFKMKLSSEPNFDHRAGALDLSLVINDSTTQHQFSNQWETTDDGFTSFKHNVWFRFVAPPSGEINIQFNAANVVGNLRNSAMQLQNDTSAVIASASTGLGGVQMNIPATGLVSGNFYYLTVGTKTAHSSYKGNFTLSIKSPDTLYTQEPVLWAINSGAWNNHQNWSVTEGGVPANTIPTEVTTVYIAGHQITFNSVVSEPVIFKKVFVNGVTGTATGLEIQTGELNVKEAIKVSGEGAIFQKSSTSTLKVTGGS